MEGRLYPAPIPEPCPIYDISATLPFNAAPIADVAPPERPYLLALGLGVVATGTEFLWLPKVAPPGTRLLYGVVLLVVLLFIVSIKSCNFFISPLILSIFTLTYTSTLLLTSVSIICSMAERRPSGSYVRGSSYLSTP